MTITINLNPEKEARLRQKAARAGRPVEQLAVDFVLRGVDEMEGEESVTAPTSNEPSLAELFAGRTGLVDIQETTPDALVSDMVKEKLPVPQETREERKARIQAITGSMAYLGPSRILESRAEDRMREEKHQL